MRDLINALARFSDVDGRAQRFNFVGYFIVAKCVLFVLWNVFRRLKLVINGING